MSSTNQIKIDGASFTKLTHDNYAEWVINIRAILRRNKLWTYTQEELAKDKEVTKWEEAADIMTPTILSAIQQRLSGKNFNNGYKI